MLLGADARFRADLLSQWKPSIADPSRWAVVRVTNAASVLDFFDTATQKQILAALKVIPSGPRVPLLRMYDPKVCNHYYTGKTLEEDRHLKGMGYISQPPIGKVYMQPVPGTVPFYNIFIRYHGKYDWPHGPDSDDFYTINEEERATTIRNGGKDNGPECYVFKDQAPDTVPVYRMCHHVRQDHYYTTNSSEKDQMAAQGYMYEGVACYIYPM